MANSTPIDNTAISDGHQSQLSTAVEGSTTSVDIKTDNSGRFQTGFGCLSGRPALLQFLASARWFLFCMCISDFFRSMIVNGLVGTTISTIERRFGLSSSDSAWILATYEIAGVPALLVIGYFGSVIRRPVWIGGSLIVLGVGFGIYSIPHFAAPPYSYVDSGDWSNLCVETTSKNASLTANNRCSSDESDGGSTYVAAFIVAMVLIPIGTIPLHVLGINYLDDASPHGTFAVHFAIFYSMGILGTVVAFIGGGFLLKLYTHIDTIDTSTITLQEDDPRWVGAWWIGFLACMVATLVIAPVFFGYPPEPSNKYHREKSTSNNSSDSQLDHHEPVLDLRAEGLAGVWKTAKSLITNGPYMFIVLEGTFDDIIVSGFIAFGVKYFQQQFGMTASMAGIVYGVITVPGAAGGLILGSIIIKRLKPTIAHQLRAKFLLGIACLCALLAFAVQCDTAPLADVSSHELTDKNGDNSSKSTCNFDCSCDIERFEPVCGADGLTYFSPCYAGCHNLLGNTDYGNCSCIGDVSTNMSDVNSTAVQGVCAVTSCNTWRLVVFFIMFFVAMILIFVNGMFHLSSMLRIVKHSERALAYAVDWLIQRVAGGVPGPILFGFVLDHSCLLWEKECDGSTGSCLFYDNHQMAWLLLAVCAAGKVLNILCCLASWRLYVYRCRKGDLPQTGLEHMPTVNQTGNEATGNSNGSTAGTEVEVQSDQDLAITNPTMEAENNDL